MAYDPELRGCFGEQDLKFAVHPMDAGRAFDWLASLRKRQIGLSAARAQVAEFLTQKGAGPVIIDEQLASVDRRLGPWLGD
jgi:hypothetical protein